jgi:cytochrome c-type biogenesis protein CcmH
VTPPARAHLPRAGRLLACAFAIAAVLILPASAAAADARADLPDIEDEVMCTICGTLLQLSDSPQANRERALIRRLIDEGRSKDEIKDALVAEYGQEVLATPDSKGFDLAAWLVPGAVIALALAGIVLGVARLTRRSRDAAPARVPELDASDRERLERDMSAHEL